MSFIDNMVFRYRGLRYREKPIPQIELDARWLVPNWALRIMLGLLCLGLMVPAGITGGAPGFLIIGLSVGLVGWLLWWPWYPQALIAGCAGALFLIGGEVHPWQGFAMACAGYAALRLGEVLELTGWGGKIQLTALFSPRDLLVLGATALLTGLSLIPLPSPVLLAVLATTALLGLGFLLRPRFQ
jgi:hypothetical protein